jgi:hypothetical protein
VADDRHLDLLQHLESILLFGFGRDIF